MALELHRGLHCVALQEQNWDEDTWHENHVGKDVEEMFPSHHESQKVLV